MPLLDSKHVKTESPVKKPVETKVEEPEDSEVTIIASPKSEKTILEEKPQPKVKPEPKVYSPVVETNTSTTDNGNSSMWKILGTIAVGIIAIILINNGGIGCNNTTVEGAVPVDSVAANPIANRMQYESPLGGCQYSGPIDELNLPNGIGEAFFNDGRYYQGGFEHGVFTGEDCYFRYANGDEFKGKFRKNQFYYGTYTIASDQSYYVGDYKDGQPNSGTWYDKNGKVIQ
jgi:hypothetical protein